jgi:hypothetical protein
MERFDAAFKANGLTLEVGCKVLVKLRAELRATYGFQVEVLDVDPTYTLGDHKARMEAIRARLRDAGHWDRNRVLARPRDFLRVAVISPAGAAGLGDFQSTAVKMSGRGARGLRVFRRSVRVSMPCGSAARPRRGNRGSIGARAATGCGGTLPPRARGACHQIAPACRPSAALAILPAWAASTSWRAMRSRAATSSG